MKKLLMIAVSLIYMGLSEGPSYGQTVGKWTFSAMHSPTANDSVFQATGQVMSGESSSPKVLHGYYPFQYSLLSVNEESRSFEAYPNPFDQVLFLEFHSLDGLKSLELFDLQGKLVYTKDNLLESTSIDLTSLSHGMYSVVIHHSEGIFTQKIIKL